MDLKTLWQKVYNTLKLPLLHKPYINFPNNIFNLLLLQKPYNFMHIYIGHKLYKVSSISTFLGAYIHNLLSKTLLINFIVQPYIRFIRLGNYQGQNLMKCFIRFDIKEI